MRRIVSDFDDYEHIHLADTETFEAASWRDSEDPPELKTLCGEVLKVGMYEHYEFRQPNSSDLHKADCRFCLRVHLGIATTFGGGA